MNSVIYTERVSKYLKKNIIEDLESESLVYTIIGEFLTDLEQNIGGGNNETMKVIKLKKIE